MKKLLMGNEAFAHAALEAGVRAVAGYPGTPSSEVVETIAKLQASGAAHGVHVEWSTNEKAALELLAGASLAGARCLFTCKQMGLNVASDALMSLNYIGVRGGLVLFVADDPGPISSQTEQDTRRFAAFAKVPVLDPATPEQGFAMMKEAFELSERYGTPVIVRPTTRVCHASAFFDIAESTEARAIPEEGFRKDPRWIIFPKRSYEAHAEIVDRLDAMAHDFSTEPAFAAFNAIEAYNPCEHDGAQADGTGVGARAPRLGIVAGGVSAAYAREALRMLAGEAHATGEVRAAGEAPAGEVPPYRFMQIGTPYPFPQQQVERFADGLDGILVLEELDSTLEEQLLAFAGKTHASFDVYGKLTGDVPVRGELSVDAAYAILKRFFGLAPDAHANAAADDGDGNGSTASALDSLPVRPPVLCAGCPHRGSFYAVKRALGKTPAVYCGDIGCYTLGNAAPLLTTDTCLCMGAGITMAQGLAAVEPGKKHIAFVGDSTFFASGLTGLANAVYNGHDITVCVLDNSTTAMTGGQPHPGTGVTLMGQRRSGISIRSVLEALGFGCIEEADPLVHAEARDAAQRALDFEGPSAIIFKSPCIQLVKPGEPVAVDPQLCTGCKRCITEIGCPALGFNAQAQGVKSANRGQAFVDERLCNGCTLCTQICVCSAISHRVSAGSRNEVRHARENTAISGTADADSAAQGDATSHLVSAKEVSRD